MVITPHPRPADRRNLMMSLWNRRSAAALLLFGGLAACDEPVPVAPPDNGGGGTTPLAITSTSPAADVLTAPFGLVVTATADAAVQPSTATVTSFNIVTDADGFDVPRRILVTGGNQVQATASLLPGTKYRATISTALRSTNGGALPAPFTWSFTTRPIVPFVLDTGRVGYFGHLALAKDSLGGLHAVYADSVQGDLFYAECAGVCAAPANWTVVALDTLGNIGSSSAIAVDASNRIHIVYRDDRLQRFRYATCVTPCTDVLQFAFATVDSSSIGVGIAPSITVTPAGIVHTVYYDYINAYLRYGICLAACGLATNWVNGTADPGGSTGFVGESSAILVDGATRHVVYQDSAGSNLKYATCTTACVGAGDWTVGAISVADGGKSPSLAFGPNKELEVTYYAATTGAAKFALCASACFTIANWTTIDLATTPLVGQVTGLTVDAFGRAQAVLIDDGLKQLRFATCSSVCTTASRWRYSTIEVSLSAFRSPALVPGGAGGVQLLYLSSEGQAVRFAQ
jgi:Bacterial Ig-like domain